MAEKIVRCPYCVLGDNFMEMVGHVDGRMICRRCGHVVKTWDTDFKCGCPKCREMRFPAGATTVFTLLD
jgi:hypothetical protein